MSLDSQVFTSRCGYRGAQVVQRGCWQVVLTYGGVEAWSDEFSREEDAVRVAREWALHDVAPRREEPWARVRRC